MTTQEALHEVSTMVYRNTDNFAMTISKDCYKAIVTALERQTPKKPIKESLADRYCPNCDGYIAFDALNDSILDAPVFCKHCGQALDWRTDNA